MFSKASVSHSAHGREGWGLPTGGDLPTEGGVCIQWICLQRGVSILGGGRCCLHVGLPRGGVCLDRGGSAYRGGVCAIPLY